MRRVSLAITLAALLSLNGCDFFSDSDTYFTSNPGPILFVSDQSGERQLYSMLPDGSDVRVVIRNSSFQTKSARWSPDGKWILLKGGIIHDGHSTGSSLYLFVAGGQLHRSCGEIRGSTWNLDERMIWSPGARSYFEGFGSVYSQQFRLDVDACTFERVSEVGSIHRTDFTDVSNDGLMLLGETQNMVIGHETEPSSWDIRASFWNSGGDSLTSIGEVGAQYLGSMWSTSENFLAVGIRTHEYHRLYRMTTDGANRLQLTGDEFNAVFPIAWSSDDTQILARARKSMELRWSIIMVDANGGGVKDLSPFPGASSYPTSWLTGM